MSSDDKATRRPADLELGDDVTAVLREQLPVIAELIVSAITEEVPSYADAFSGRMGPNIENAVRLALATFLKLASQAKGADDPGTLLGPAAEAAYALGRGEARSGRSMDALLAAYRVGARVFWSEVARIAVRGGLSAETVARFAELVFAYIDELSAASATGHADELATTGRVRQRYLERLANSLLTGAPAAAGRPGARGVVTGRPEDAAAGRAAGHRLRQRPGRTAGTGCRRAVPEGAAARAARPPGRGGSGPSVAAGAGVVRPCRPGAGAGSGCPGHGRHRRPPDGPGARRRPRSAGRPAGQGAGAARGVAARKRGQARRDAAVLDAAPGPP